MNTKLRWGVFDREISAVAWKLWRTSAKYANKTKVKIPPQIQRRLRVMLLTVSLSAKACFLKCRIAIADAITIANQTGATVISNYEIVTRLGKNGVKNVSALNPGGTFSADFGRVKCVNAIHSSSFEDGTYGGSASGFVVESTAGNFYYSGDTALTLDMKLVSETTKLTFAILCIGGTLTMDTEEAIRAAELLECKEVIGMHYDTFPPIVIDHAAAKDRFRSKGLTLHLLPIGGSQNF